jgi:predicted Zn-dependent protease
MRTLRRYAARLFLSIPVDPPLRSRRGLLLAWYVTVVCLAVIASTAGVKAADFTTVLTDTGTKTLQAVEVEAVRAVEQHPQLLAALGGDYGDPALGAYITAVAERLLAQSDAAKLGHRFRFVVVDSPSVFALSMAGGNIYISRGMLALANSEAELAAVLAHEISHVVLRHGAERERLMRSMRGRSNLAAAEQALTVGQELEADDFSLYLMAEAGYDPRAQGRFLAAVARMTETQAEIGVGGRGEFLNQHLDVRGRLAAANAAADRFVTRRSEWFDGTEPFLQAVEGMVYGRRPADGMIDGPVYVDATNGFRFELPPGFRFIEVGGAAVNAAGPSGASLRVDVKAEATTDMVAYLRESVADTLPALKPQAITLNGRPGAKASVTVDTAAGPASVEFVVVQLSAYSVARYQAVIPHSLSKHFIDAVRDVPKSLRPLDADTAEVAPLRVRVLIADADQPAVAFAAQMRSMDRPLEWFLAINQLSVDATVRAGSRIKLIAP